VVCQVDAWNGYGPALWSPHPAWKQRGTTAQSSYPKPREKSHYAFRSASMYSMAEAPGSREGRVGWQGHGVR